MTRRSPHLLLPLFILMPLLLFSCGSDSGPAPSRGPFALMAWNDLGMHCMDNDYSVFSILPPYNNLHAQLIDRSSGRLVGGSEGISLTYEATPDTNGSINTFSALKTNFWQWVMILFGAQPAPDIGLTGNPVPSRNPAAMIYDSSAGYWKAEGIPVVPYDDNGEANYYPMVKVVARDTSGNNLAEIKTVTPVSDEMTCIGCHASGGGADAQPAGGWVYDPDPGKDWKRNILRIHDEKNLADPIYADALAAYGYDSLGLLSTADKGVPVLCAKCHASNALGTAGASGVKPLTTAMHSWHAHVIEDATGQPLDSSSNRTACYTCHPGSTTQCLRGCMGNAKDASGNPAIQCQNCHGAMSKVGDPARRGWMDLPACQNCHYLDMAAYRYVRDNTVFDVQGNFRQAPGVFMTGGSLYKVGIGHGGVQCEGCHGPTHAEYPSSEANDNVQGIALQGYAGKITECSVCHLSVPLTRDGGPHGLHTVGQAWVDGHGLFAKTGSTYCATCHGSDYAGTNLSRTSAGKTFTSLKFGISIFQQGHAVSCYDCHNGPGG